MSRLLVLLRHGKSDWTVATGDRQRPLSRRGVRQARQAGGWLATHGPSLDLAVVSTAVRAQSTWEHASSALPEPPPVRSADEAYTFDGEQALEIVRGLGAARAVVLVGHNPALEEAVQRLTLQWAAMPTACLAVVELDEWSADRGRLLAHGRPPREPIRPLR